MELCQECNKPYTGRLSGSWCQRCNAERFQRDFNNWASENEFIDRFIQETQINAQDNDGVLEWIPYNRLANVEYLARGGFSTVYKATWLDGKIVRWDNNNNKWFRDVGYSRNEVAIKKLDNSSNINGEFLSEVVKLFY